MQPIIAFYIFTAVVGLSLRSTAIAESRGMVSK